MKLSPSLWSTAALMACLTVTESKKRPNILFVLTDDQDKHMGGVDYMPVLQDRVVNKGATWPKHFCTVALCCPSRANLWTGRLPHNTNVTDVAPPWGGYDAVVQHGWNDNYLPLWMQNAGYNTYYLGKMWNHHTIDNYDAPFVRGFNGSDFLLDPYTYRYYDSMMTHDGAEPVSYKGSYSTDVISGLAQKRLDDALSHPEQPWMLTVAPVGCHATVSVNEAGNVSWFSIPQYPPRHADLFKDYSIPRGDSFNKPIQNGAPSWLGELGPLNDTVIAYNDEYQRARLRSLMSVDEMIGALIDKIEEAGELDNTYIFFSTDNGYHISQRALQPGKQCGFDTDINIPLFVRGPGISSGAEMTALTSHTDLAPTFLTIAGVDVSDMGFDGTAIPLTEVKDTKNRAEHVAIEYWGTGIPEGEYGYRAITTNGTTVNIGGYLNNTYRGIRVLGEDYSLYYSVWCTNQHELYDNLRDPEQTTNLLGDDAGPHQYKHLEIAGRPMHQVVDRLDALISVMKYCKEDACVEPWRQLHPKGNVKSLKDALHSKFDKFYASEPKNYFDKCELGFIKSSEHPHGFETLELPKTHDRRRHTIPYGESWILYT